MKKNPNSIRHCKDCPTWTQTVCHHAFGVYWCIKSQDGDGCRYPLDEVAETWRKAGWTPDKGEVVPITVPVRESPKPVRKVPPKKLQQLDLVPTAGPPPLSDDDY